MNYKLYIKHKLTAYHFRRTKWWPGRKTYLSHCNCGWTAWMWRKLKYEIALRGIVCLFMGGHKWEEPEEAQAGSIDFEESEDTLLYRYQQCEFCWKIKKIREP